MQKFHYWVINGSNRMGLGVLEGYVFSNRMGLGVPLFWQSGFAMKVLGLKATLFCIGKADGGVHAG